MNPDLTIRIGQDETLIFHDKPEGCTVHATDSVSAAHLFLTTHQMAALRDWLDLCLMEDYE
jgi:hypothetical protein